MRGYQNGMQAVVSGCMGLPSHGQKIQGEHEVREGIVASKGRGHEIDPHVFTTSWI